MGAVAFGQHAMSLFTGPTIIDCIKLSASEPATGKDVSLIRMAAPGRRDLGARTTEAGAGKQAAAAVVC